MVMVNEMSKRGAMEVTIFKIPGPDAIKWTKKDIHRLICMSFSYLM